MRHGFIYILLLGLLFTSCSKEPQISASGEKVAIDFKCDGITRSDDSSETDYMFTLVAENNSGEPVSDVYSNVGSTLTPSGKILAVNNATYKLVIASPAKKMVALDTEETSAYGYKIERNGPDADQPYINNTPISVTVNGIKANNTYTYNLKEVTLKEQRSKVKVQFRVIDEKDARTLTKLYYTKVYNTVYTCPNSGLLYGDNLPNNDVYEFTKFENDGTGNREYRDTVSVVEPTINSDNTTYFISGDYTDLTKGNTPYLCIGLLQDGEVKSIEMPLDIVMEPMMSYTYDIKISSTELTINVTSTDEWTEGCNIGGGIGKPVGSFTLNIITGKKSEWTGGSNDNGVFEPPLIVPDPEEEVDFTDDKSSNCYILNPSQDKTTIYYIPIRRIDEFWDDANYVADGSNNTLANVGENWEAVIYWHDFSSPESSDAISTLTVEKCVVPETTTPAVKVTLPKEFYNPINHCNVGYLVRRTDTKEVLWSWHLWITDYNPTALIEQYKDQIESNTAKAYGETVDGRKNEIHRYNGTLWDGEGIYKDKFIMDRNIGARSPDFEGHGAVKNKISAPGTLHYQFGRKDPLPAYYIAVNGYNYGKISGVPTFKDAVNHPNFFLHNTSNYNWCSEGDNPNFIWHDYTLLKTNYTVGKSIFDPSPQGFRLPIYGTWSEFTGSSAKDESESPDSYTFKLINNIGGTASTPNDRLYNGFAYYPATGSRYWASGGIDKPGTNGYCWSATPYTTTGHAYTLIFYSTVGSTGGQNRGGAHPIRPIQE